MDLQRGFRIGSVTVHPNSGEIGSGDAGTRIEPKVMDVLLVLAAEPQEVVLREELLDRVWGRSAATADESLTRAITQLRQALGDSPRNPDYIQTIPRRGYRLLQPVTPLTADAAPPDETAAAIAPSVLRRRGVIAAICAVALLAIGLWALQKMSAVDESGRDAAFAAVTSAPGTAEPMTACNAEAQRLHDEGARLMLERSFLLVRDAIEYFRAAIDADPACAVAYFDRAYASILLPYYASTLGAEAREIAQQRFDEAFELLGLALTYGPELRDRSHLVYAFYYHTNWQWLDAEAKFMEALAATPSDGDLYQRYASFLSDTGRLRDAQDAAEQAVRLDPRNPVNRDREAVTHILQGNYAEADRLFEELHQLFPSHTPNPDAQLVLLYASGRFRELAEALKRFEWANELPAGWEQVLVNAFSGPDDREARLAAAALIDGDAASLLPARYILGAWLFLGNWDKAYAQAFLMADQHELRHQLDLEVLFSAAAREFREQPQFAELLRQVGLDSYLDQSALEVSDLVMW